MVSVVSGARLRPVSGEFEPGTVIAPSGETRCDRDGSLNDILDAIVRITGAEGGSIVWTATGTEPVVVTERGNLKLPCGLPVSDPMTTDGTGS